MLKSSYPTLFLSVPPQVPDYTNAKILGLPATTVIDDEKWLEEEFTPRVQTVSGTLASRESQPSPCAALD